MAGPVGPLSVGGRLGHRRSRRRRSCPLRRRRTSRGSQRGAAGRHRGFGFDAGLRGAFGRLNRVRRGRRALRSTARRRHWRAGWGRRWRRDGSGGRRTRNRRRRRRPCRSSRPMHGRGRRTKRQRVSRGTIRCDTRPRRANTRGCITLSARPHRRRRPGRARGRHRSRAARRRRGTRGARGRTRSHRARGGRSSRSRGSRGRRRIRRRWASLRRTRLWTRCACHTGHRRRRRSRNGRRRVWTDRCFGARYPARSGRCCSAGIGGTISGIRQRDRDRRLAVPAGDAAAPFGQRPSNVVTDGDDRRADVTSDLHRGP